MIFLLIFFPMKNLHMSHVFVHLHWPAALQPFSPSVIEAKEKSVTEKEQRVQREMKALKEKERIIAMKKGLVSN